MPSALPLSIPLGLTFGILWGLGRVAASRRTRTLILLLADCVGRIVHHVGLGRPNDEPSVPGLDDWTAGPERRERTHAGRTPPAARTRNTRTAPVSAPSDVRRLALNYHTRWALAGAPLVLAFFAVALTSRRQGPDHARALGASRSSVTTWPCIRPDGSDWTARLSAFAAAWIPNIAFLILSVAIMTLSSQRTNGPARA